MSRLGFLLVGLVGVVGCACSAAEDGEPTEVEPRVVFESKRDRYDGFGIHSVDVEGKEVRTLSSSELLGDNTPDFTPDGMRMAYTSCRTSEKDGWFEVYVKDFEAGTDVNLTQRLDGDAEPSWSPDGTRIAFSAEIDFDWHIFVMDSDGSNVTEISTDGEDREPQWSPDGELILFQRQVSGADAEVMVVRPDGSGLVSLSDHPSRDCCGAWSPDGQRITFYSEREDPTGGCGDVFSVRRDGTDLRRLTTEPGWSGGARWSPDGLQIVFVRTIEYDTEIWSMSPNGAAQRQLTDSEGGNWSPSWSPEGDYIAFVSDRDGNSEIYVMRPDGADQRRLTHHPDIDMEPTWRPRHWE